MSDLQAKLNETEFRGEELETGQRGTNRFKSQLLHLVKTSDFWHGYENESFDELHQILLQETNFANLHRYYPPETFKYSTSEYFEEFYNIYRHNALLDDLSDELDQRDYLRDYTTEEATREFPPEITLDMVKSIKRNSKSLPVNIGDEEVAEVLESKGFSLLTEVPENLINMEIMYWEVLADRFEHYEADGGERPSLYIISSTAGEVLAGGYAIGHDTFMDPNDASIIAGIGLISSGLKSWEEIEQQMKGDGASEQEEF